MADNSKNIAVALAGDEIEPTGVYDYKLRKAYNSDIPRFRGLSGQMTINPDDKNRISVWKGTELGAKEDVPFVSDLQEGTLTIRAKHFAETSLKADVSTTTYVIDPSQSHRFFLNINTPEITFSIADTFDKAAFINIVLYLTNIKAGTKYTFKPTQVDWLGDISKLDNTVGALNIVNLAFNGKRWVAYSLDRTVNDRFSLKAVDEAVVSNSRLIGWVLDAGSTDGEISDRYATKTSILDLSDEDLNNIARVSSSIYDVIDVSLSLEDIHKIEDYVDSIKACGQNIEAIKAVVPQIYTLAWINSHIELLETIYNNKDNVDKVGNSIKNVDSVAGALEAIEAVYDNLDKINTLNTYKQSVIVTAENIEQVNSVSDNVTQIQTLAANINALLKIEPALSNIKINAENIDSINALGLSMDNVKAIYGSLPQIININNNIDNITNMGNYINKGVMLRTEMKDTLEASYEATDLNKLYLVPAGMSDSLEID